MWSKLLDATCDASGLVTAEGVTVPAAEVLSEGNQASEGLLFIQGEKARYLPSSATDIKTTIENLITVIDKISDAVTKTSTMFTATYAVMTGPTTAPPPTGPADVILLTGYVTELAAVKTQLNTLKGALK